MQKRLALIFIFTNLSCFAQSSSQAVIQVKNDEIKTVTLSPAANQINQKPGANIQSTTPQLVNNVNSASSNTISPVHAKSMVIVPDVTAACTGNNCTASTHAVNGSRTLDTSRHHHKRYSHKRHYSYHHKSNPTYALNEMSFDFSYSGDVLNLPQNLKQYDQTLNILSPTGNKKNINVNFDLQNIKLQDVADALKAQTNGEVTLQYTPENNSVRLIYNTIVNVGKDAVAESLKWQNGNNPKPVLDANGIVRFPYGLYQPVVTCQPLNLCDIQLQANEEILGIVIGDSLRWNQGDKTIPIVYSGTPNNLTPHLILKPGEPGLQTSLLITTTKHTYMIKLKSSTNNYVAQVGFYYPDEMLEHFESQKMRYINKTQASQVTKGNNPALKLPFIDLNKLNYNYKISGDNYPWKPLRVFDDGISVYIQMPSQINSRDLPGICVLEDGDVNENKCELVNYRYNNNFFIVDKLFNTAHLVNGYGDSSQIITIKKTPDKPGFWQRLFGN